MTLKLLPWCGKVLIFLILLFPGPRAAWTQEQTATVPERLTLDQAMQLALERNPALLRDRQNIAVARANLLQARQRPNPEVDVGSESYPAFESRPGSFFNNQEMTLRAGQTIETAGKRGKRAAVAGQELAATGSDVQNTLRQLRLELKQRYYSVVLAKAQRDLAEEILKQFDGIIRLNEERYKQGEVSGLDLNRVKAERLRFFTDLLESDLQLKNAKTALLELLAFGDLAAPFDVTEQLKSRPLTEQLADLQGQASAARPDMKAGRERLERDRQQVGLEQALAVPDVTPFAGYKRDFGANTLAFGVTLPLPLFNRNQGGVARAAAQIVQRQHELDRLTLAVRREVQEAYQRVQTQNERIRALEQEYVPNVRRTRDIAQQSYRLGALDLIGLLDAERVYRETLRAYNLALFDYNAAVFQLEAAVGKEF